MREIKFRAWDKRESKMWVPIIDQDGFPCAQHPVSMQLVRMDGELLDPVMQYTGLKDKNGKEIYEGDIATWYVNDVERTGEVYYTGQAFDMRNDVSGYGYIGLDALRGEVEVIGNIYENPELMED